jgi:hypothetical protein
MFNRLTSLFRPKSAITDPYEQFVVAFIEECKRQGRKPTSYDHQALCWAQLSNWEYPSVSVRDSAPMRCSNTIAMV